MDEKHFRKITFNESFEAVASAAFDKVRVICQLSKDYFREGITEGITNMEKYLTPESYKALTTASNDDDKRIIEVRNRLIEQMVDSFLAHYQPQQLISEVDTIVSIANRLALKKHSLSPLLALSLKAPSPTTLFLTPATLTHVSGSITNHKTLITFNL